MTLPRGSVRTKRHGDNVKFFKHKAAPAILAVGLVTGLVAVGTAGSATAERSGVELRQKTHTSYGVTYWETLIYENGVYK